MGVVVADLMSSAKKRHNDTERLYTKVQSYTTLCINILVLSGAIFLSYFLPVLWFNVYFRYDHVTVVFKKDWFIGLGLIIMAIFLLVTIIYAKLARSNVVAAAYVKCDGTKLCDCHTTKKELVRRVRRLTILMIIIQSWNIFTVVAPIYAACHFFLVSRPSGKFFVGIFVREELKKSMHQILESTMDLMTAMSSMSATKITAVDTENIENQVDERLNQPSDLEVILIGIFKPNALTPVFALTQVFVLTIVYCIIFTHTAYIRCIYYAIRYQKCLQTEIRECNGHVSSCQSPCSQVSGQDSQNTMSLLGEQYSRDDAILETSKLNSNENSKGYLFI